MKKLLALFCLLTAFAHGQGNLPLAISPTPVRLYPTSPATSFTVAHGYGAIPLSYQVTAASASATGAYYVTADATNLTITYLTAPASGTNNLIWKWTAQ